MKPQYIQIAELLAERIHYGDYLLTEIPATRKLAGELGVSHIVARKAVEKLIADGLCCRQANGRIAISHSEPSAAPAAESVRRLRVAILQPSFASNYFQRCGRELEAAAESRRILCRRVFFVHWQDPVVRETLQNFDGVFLFGSSETPEVAELKLFREHRTHLMTVDFDLTEYGIPRLAFFAAECVPPLIDHLAALGIRRIDCINTQPADVETLRRIEAWSSAVSRIGGYGTLHNEPVESYADPTRKAYALVTQLASRSLDAEALFCTNENIAYGVSRALLDHGLRPGRDIAVCAVGDGGNARYFSPSITCAEMPDLTQEIGRAFDWMSLPERKVWDGALTLRAARQPLFFGESTIHYSQKKEKVEA